MRISLSGEVMAQLVSANADSLGIFKTGRRYDLVRVHLVKVGCPRELTAARENRRNMPLVIEKNRRKYGLVQSTGYYPEAVVVAGDYRRGQLMARGVLNDFGWVERGSMKIQADDAISCGELMEKLSNLLQVKIYGGNKPLTGQPWPYVCQVYPFENYMIYDFAGQKYRQRFALDPIERDVKLDGDPVKVNEKFVNASEAGMPRAQTGGHFVTNPLPLASNQVPSRGGLNSDLVTMMVRNFSNVNAVVSKMLVAMKTGLYRPLKPDFAPVNLSDSGKILGPLVEAGIAPVDFVCWADKHGEPYMDAHVFSDEKRKKMAKAGTAMSDGSYPIANANDLKNAVKSFGRSPDQATKRHIVKRARAIGRTDILPDKWKKKTGVKAFGKFKSAKHGAMDQKKAAFKV